MDAAQVQRNRPDRADAIEAKINAVAAAKLLQRFDVIEDSRRRFAMYRPKPANVFSACKLQLERANIQRLAPGFAKDRAQNPVARSMIDEALSEFALCDHNAAIGPQR